MKILITSDWYYPDINGVVTSVLNLKNELIRAGHEVKVLTLSGDLNSYNIGNVTYIHSISVGKLYPNARIRLPFNNKWMRELMEWKPDIIHSQCEFSTFGLAKQLANKLARPLVHTYHTVYEDYTHYFSPNKKIGKKSTAVLSRFICNQTEHVIVPTEKVKSLLLEYGITKKISVIPSGIDTEKFNRDNLNEARKIIRNNLGIHPKEKVLLSLGRLAKEKNIDEIISNLSEYKGEKITLLIVGDGPFRDELVKKAGEMVGNVNVIFTGMVEMDQTAAYYAAADLFVSASNSETQGLTYVEAISVGLPLLCKKDECLKDVLLQDKNGWSFNEKDEFIQKLNEFMESSKEKINIMSATSEIISKKYSQQIFASKMEQIYRSEVQRKENYCLKMGKEEMMDAVSSFKIND